MPHSKINTSRRPPSALSSWRRIILVSERVDVDTEILSTYGERSHGNSGMGRGSRNSEYVLSLLVWRRSTVGPRLVGALPTKSAQRTLAMRLSRNSDVDENGDPVHHESIASVYGASNLVQALRRYLDTQITLMWGSAQTNISTEASAARLFPGDPQKRCHSG